MLVLGDIYLATKSKHNCPKESKNSVGLIIRKHKGQALIIRLSMIEVPI